MIPAQEVKELSELSLEALIYELLEFVEKNFKPVSPQLHKYYLSKFVVISELIKEKLIEPFEQENND